MKIREEEKNSIHFLPAKQEKLFSFFFGKKIMAYDFSRLTELCYHYRWIWKCRMVGRGVSGWDVCLYALPCMMINTREVWKINDFFAFLLLIFMISSFAIVKYASQAEELLIFIVHVNFCCLIFIVLLLTRFSEAPAPPKRNFFDLFDVHLLALLLKWLSIKSE